MSATDAPEQRHSDTTSLELRDGEISAPKQQTRQPDVSNAAAASDQLYFELVGTKKRKQKRTARRGSLAVGGLGSRTSPEAGPARGRV